VANAAIKAGFSLCLCDIAEDSLNLDPNNLKQCETENIAAIIPAHLFGIPCDMNRITTFTRNHNLFAIEDTSQALGALYKNKPVGSTGDFSFFSFGLSKPLVAINGGAIGVNNDTCVNAIKSTMANNILRPSVITNIWKTLELAGYSLLINPRLYPLLRKTPVNFNDRAIKIETQKGRRLTNVQSRLIMQSIGNIDKVNNIRKKNGKYLLEHLNELEEIRTFTSSADSTAIYLRFPVIFPNKTIRNKTYNSLLKLGIETDKSYDQSIGDIELFKNHIVSRGNTVNARQAADRILCLPTHPMITREHLNIMINTIKKTCHG